MATSAKPKLTPAELYGPLFSAVQEGGIFADGKAFVDAVPRRPIEAILKDFESLGTNKADLLSFVHANFDLPQAVSVRMPAAFGNSLRDYIRSLWPALSREPQLGVEFSSELKIAHRHVVPGGRFREIYYWDSFFSMLGLIRDGELELANGIVNAMTDLIEEHGYVPNGARTYFLGRSQPPLFHMMVALLPDAGPEVAARRLEAMKREHAWWMAGASELRPGVQINRVAMLADGSILNRYWDPRETPRDETWGEDVATARRSNRPVQEVYRELRAGAESGWDFSSRWFEGDNLSSIQTTRILPIDLNAFLYGLEMAIATSGGEESAYYADRAQQRLGAIQRHLWDTQLEHFCDYDLKRGARRAGLTAAALVPLLAGVATQSQADATAGRVREKLLAPGGLRTSLVESGEQWDKPNGWAPLQWIGCVGLHRYGHGGLAREVAERWVTTVDEVYQRTGVICEKYNVETRCSGAGGEYEPQIGFGWTNGVTADLMGRLLEWGTRQ